MKILIVDDEPVNVFLLTELLNDQHEIETAFNGKEAYDTARNASPDLVLMDIMMPEMDGFEALELFKSDKDVEHIPIIMVSARIERTDVQKAMSSGAADYLKKPVDITDLYTKIEIQKRLIERHKNIKEQAEQNIFEEKLENARRIQELMLPDKNRFERIFPNFFRIFLPKSIVSGDFYFLSQLNSTRFLSVFDSTGHGVSGGLLSTIYYMIFDYIVNKLEITSPEKVVSLFQEQLLLHLNYSSDTFTSVGFDGLICQFDSATRSLNFIGLKRPLIVIRKSTTPLVVNSQEQVPDLCNQNKCLYHIKGDLSAISNNNKSLNIKQQTLHYLPGDILYFSSDGFIDQFGGLQNKKFGKKRFLNLLLEHADLDMKTQKLKIYQTFRKWRGEQEQLDDVLLIGILV